jgi:FSR family fosmidomycin resistance protein-like MFS transporter
MNKKNSQFNRLQIYLSAGSHFIIDIYQSFIIGLIPVLTLKFGLSLFQVGLLTATGVIAKSFSSPIFGYLSDHHGIRYYLITGLLLTSVFLSLIGILPNYYFLLAFLFLGNLGVAAFHPASAAIAGHFGGNKKGLGSSIISFGGIFGNSLGALLIILVIEKLNMRFTPLTMIPGLITVIILFKLIPRTQENSTGNIKNLFSRIKKVNKERWYRLFLIMLATYSLNIMWITLVTYMPLYYTEANISLINIGVILLFFGMLGAAGGLISGFIFDRYRKGSVIIQAGLALAIPLFFFTFEASGLISIILFILGGLFLISIAPVCIRMTQDLMPGNMSLASSLILGLGPGFAGITMIILGKAADIIGIEALVKYELILIIFAIILLFSFPLAERGFVNKKIFDK